MLASAANAGRAPSPQPLRTHASGPALHAEVGDTIVLVLRNNAPFAVNAEPGGMDAPLPVSLNPGDTITYRCAPPPAGVVAPAASTRLCNGSVVGVPPISKTFCLYLVRLV